MTLITCDYCGNEAPKDKIKYVPLDSKNIKVMCFKCANLDKKKEEKKDVKSLVHYYCRRCDYDFRNDPLTESTLRCPYCGKFDQLEKKSIGKII
jgi:hypothetical protein